jgi:ankyrin repeat protein
LILSHKCQLTYRLFEHERVVEGNTVVTSASETVNTSSSKENASETPDLEARYGTKRKDEPFIREEFYFKHVHYHREIQVIKTNSIPTPIVEVEPQQLNVEELPPLHRAAANGALAEINELLDNSEMVDSPLLSNAVLDKPVGGRQEFRGCSPLHLAAYFGRAKAIDLLLDRGADIYAKDWLAAQPLHYTLTGENYAVAILLLSRGADVNAPNKDGNSFLHRVCEKGITWLLSPILEYGGDLAAGDIDRSNALHVAAYYGQEEIVGTLLRKDIAKCITTIDNYGKTPLHDAAGNGNAKIVSALLEHGASASQPDADGWTPLHLASYEGNYEAAKLLIERGCSISVQDKDGDTPLHDACHCYGGTERIVRLLLESGANPATKNNTGHTPLHIASYYSNYEVVSLLLEYGCSISAQGETGYTPLHFACGSDGTERFIRLLLESGADPATKNEKGYTPLHTASFGNNYEVVRLLLEYGCSISAQDEEGNTPLHYACRPDGSESFVRSLLEHGADIGMQNAKGLTPLHIASGSDNIPIMKVLLEAGAVKLLEIEDNARLTPLLLACWANSLSNNNTEAIKLLLSHGANVKIQDEDGDTPLHSMAWAGNSELSTIMLASGADFDAQANCGSTPLFYASQYDHAEVVEILLKHGAGVNTQNKEGNTPLHRASYEGHEAVAKVLLKYGADAMATNNFGDIPLHLASMNGHLAVVKHLLEHGGGDINAGNSVCEIPLRSACIRGHGFETKLIVDGTDDVNTQTNTGATALHVACLEISDQSLQVVEYLLDNGSDPFIKDASECTPLDIASESEGMAEIAALLRKRMSDN